MPRPATCGTLTESSIPSKRPAVPEGLGLPHHRAGAAAAGTVGASGRRRRAPPGRRCWLAVSSNGRWRTSPASGTSLRKADPGRTDLKARSTPCTPVTGGGEPTGQPGSPHESECTTNSTVFDAEKSPDHSAIWVPQTFTTPLTPPTGVAVVVSSARQVLQWWISPSQDLRAARLQGARLQVEERIPAPFVAVLAGQQHARLIGARRGRQVDLHRHRAVGGLAAKRRHAWAELPAGDGLVAGRAAPAARWPPARSDADTIVVCRPTWYGSRLGMRATGSSASTSTVVASVRLGLPDRRNPATTSSPETVAACPASPSGSPSASRRVTRTPSAGTPLPVDARRNRRVLDAAGQMDDPGVRLLAGHPSVHQPVGNLIQHEGRRRVVHVDGHLVVRPDVAHAVRGAGEERVDALGSGRPTA